MAELLPSVPVPYRRVLHAERSITTDTSAGKLLMFAVIAPLAVLGNRVMPRVDLDPRLEWAGFIALAIVLGLWVSVGVPLRVVVDDARLLLDFGGFRRRCIDLSDIEAISEVGHVAESRSREWRWRNGWSRWYSYVPGVILELAGGEKLLVGSGSPKKLRDALLHAMELRKATATAGEETAPTRSPPPP